MKYKLASKIDFPASLASLSEGTSKCEARFWIPDFGDLESTFRKQFGTCHATCGVTKTIAELVQSIRAKNVVFCEKYVLNKMVHFQKHPENLKCLSPPFENSKWLSPLLHLILCTSFVLVSLISNSEYMTAFMLLSDGASRSSTHDAFMHNMEVHNVCKRHCAGLI